MGLFNIFDPALDFILSPLLKLPSLVGLLIISLIITLIVTIIYKYTTDQELLKSVRDKQKKLQEEMKKHRDNPKKVMKMQKEAFASSGEMMRESFKSMLYTFIPIIILFGWIATQFAFHPLAVGQETNVTLYLQKGSVGAATITVPEGIALLSDKTVNVNNSKEINFVIEPEKEGTFSVSFVYNNQYLEKKIIVGPGDTDIKQTKMKKTWIDYLYGSREGYLSEGDVYQLKVGYDRITPFGSFSFFGWHPGWLGTYIIFSLGLSLLLRKIMKVY
jgi:uncharacterized membrane protein (DUF106 family)